MSLSLKVIGYYNHQNAGDEQYKETFVKLFDTYLRSEYIIDFLDCDKIHEYDFKKHDIIILGGGDVLNNYFLDKINKRFKRGEHLILAVSVGLPYIETLIKTNKMDIIDYIFLRTKVDLDLFKKYFFEDRIFYLPDLSYILTNETCSLDENDNIIQEIQQLKNNGKKIIAFCLSRHIYNKRREKEYYEIVKCFAEFSKYLIDLNYHIVFLPFNTSNVNFNHNDIFIHNDVRNFLIQKTNYIFIEKQLRSINILKILELSDMCIAMRFHAVLFSFYTHTPVIPIYTTRKIKNLVKEFKWEYEYELETDDQDIPIIMNLDCIFGLYDKLQKNMKIVKHKLLHINNSIMFDTHVNCLIDCLKEQKKQTETSTNKNNIDKLIDDIYDSIMIYITSKGYNSLKDVSDLNLQQTIVNIVSYRLTEGRINSEYNFGIQEKMFNNEMEYDYRNEWKWIINNELYKEKQMPFNNPNGLFNLKYIDQEDYSGSHRSGWQYVYKNLERLHNDQSDLFLDLYIDRTFHWNLEINCLLEIIPYKKPWVGFVHHTFDETFSTYNCHTLLKCEEFIESLKYCKGIFVLSKYLKDQFDIELKKKNIDVNVYVLVHPTETNVKIFSYELFKQNKEKHLIHIGGWLRNIYSFYNINLPETKFYSGFLLGDKTLKPYGYDKQTIKKIALKGKNMNNYYPHCNLLIDLESILKTSKDIQLDISDLEELSLLESLDEIERLQNREETRSIEIEDDDIIDNITRLYYLRQYRKHYKQNVSQNVSINPMTQENLQRLQKLRMRKEREIQNCSTSFPNCSISPNCSTSVNYIVNNWNRHFYEDIYKKIGTMEFIEFVDNENYDKLLSENIVYINLVDASAVNTVIECVVRRTPIIVNNHPAIVELLGDKYPLYIKSNHNDYNSINIEINNLLINDKLIKRAHNYLKRINLSQFKISTFVNNFAKILKNIR